MIRFNGEPYESKGSCTVRWGGDALSFIKKEARSLPNPFGIDRMTAPGIGAVPGRTSRDERGSW
jgi:hypothetical protein